MKPSHQPSGLNGGLDFLIDAEWSPRQALAVVELLEDLVERITRHYQSPLFELLREDRAPCTNPLPLESWPDDPPF